MENKRFLECCCTDAAEAVEAMRGGAGRVELCEDLPCGGSHSGQRQHRGDAEACEYPRECPDQGAWGRLRL